MKILAIIPVRMNSSRFPGKPMKKILGTPMIKHVYDKVAKSKIISDVYVATCDKEIFNYINSFKGKVVMTKKSHQRASDRSAEALVKIEKEKKFKFNAVVMVQGDEPMIHPNMIKESVHPIIKNKKINVVNLCGKIENKKEFYDRNCIKTVCSKNNNALYFSRQPIPWSGETKSYLKKQVCVISFKRDFLIKYVKMKPTILEKLESVDMLRILENGYNVHMSKTKYSTFAVDTASDLKKVEKLIKKKTKR